MAGGVAERTLPRVLVEAPLRDSFRDVAVAPGRVLLEVLIEANVLPGALVAELLREPFRDVADLSALAVGFVVRLNCFDSFDAADAFETALRFFEGAFLPRTGLEEGVDARRGCGARLVLAAAFLPVDFDATTAERDDERRVERVREVMMRRKRSACREAKSLGRNVFPQMPIVHGLPLSWALGNEKSDNNWSVLSICSGRGVKAQKSNARNDWSATGNYL